MTSPTPSSTTRFATKIAVLLRDDLAPWQGLNVTAFLSAAVAAAVPEIIGEPYADAEQTPYLATFGQPVLVLTGDAETLRAARARAVGRSMPVAVFTEQMFATGNDEDNRAAVAGVSGEKLDLVGIAVHGPRNGVDKVVKGSRMHP